MPGDRRILVLAFAIAAVGCASAEPNAGWTQVDTDDIRLRTDVPERRAIRIASALQDLRDVFADVAFACAFDHDDSPIDVTVLESNRDFDAAVGSMFDGFYRRGEVVLRGDLGSESERVFQHELTHRLVHVCFPAAPVWLHEGLAQFFETASLDDREFTLGRPAMVFSSEITEAETSYIGGIRVIVIPRPRLPSVDDLVHMTRDAFYRGDPRLIPSNAETLAHYAAAETLVRILELGSPALHDAFQAYLHELREPSADPTAAWERSFAGLVVEAAFQRGADSPDFETVRYPRSSQRVAHDAPRVHSMTEEEMQQHLARLGANATAAR